MVIHVLERTHILLIDCHLEILFKLRSPAKRSDDCGTGQLAQSALVCPSSKRPPTCSDSPEYIRERITDESRFTSLFAGWEREKIR